MLKLGISNRGNSLDSPEFLNAIILNTQYGTTPVNEINSPENRFSQSNSLLRSEVLNIDPIQEKNNSSISNQSGKFHEERYCDRSGWLSMCLSNKGNLYHSTYLSVDFYNESFKHNAGKSIIIIKPRNFEGRGKVVKVEDISIIKDGRPDSKFPDSFPNTFDPSSQNLHIDIPRSEPNKIRSLEGEVLEQRISLRCKGAYLNPPMISLILRILSDTSEDFFPNLNNKDDSKTVRKDGSKVFSVSFRLPVILTNFMAPTKKMNSGEFEHFWEKLVQASTKGRLSMSFFQVPVCLQLLNFRVYNNHENSDSRICLGTSTLYLESNKRVPCMLKIQICSNDEMSNCKGHSGDNEGVEVIVRSSSMVVAKIIKQIVSYYILVGSN
ncbi:adapter-related protein complex 2 alpha 1 subunit [Cryptosporidium felis]|nr:adapter-related protein complex 2 alpha 1 subunit [Cryptosporidium felis]